MVKFCNKFHGRSWTHSTEKKKKYNYGHSWWLILNGFSVALYPNKYSTAIAIKKPWDLSELVLFFLELCFTSLMTR